MQCCLWFRSVFWVRGPWPKRYSYHLSIIYMYIQMDCLIIRMDYIAKIFQNGLDAKI